MCFPVLTSYMTAGLWSELTSESGSEIQGHGLDYLPLALLIGLPLMS